MRRPKPKPVKLVAAVERALSIFSAFSSTEPTLTLADISAHTGLQKSTALRLLATLERHSYIIRLHDGRYQLGIMTMHLGSVYQAGFHGEEHILSALKQLSGETGESATYYVRQGDQRLCLLRVHSHHLLRDVVNPGDLLPMNETSAAQVLRDFDGVSWGQARMEPDLLVRATSRVGETMTASISAPVFSPDGLMGALTVSGPVGRFDFNSRHNIGLLRKVATQLNDQMVGQLSCFVVM